MCRSCKHSSSLGILLGVVVEVSRHDDTNTLSQLLEYLRLHRGGQTLLLEHVCDLQSITFACIKSTADTLRECRQFHFLILMGA